MNDLLSSIINNTTSGSNWTLMSTWLRTQKKCIMCGKKPKYQGFVSGDGFECVLYICNTCLLDASRRKMNNQEVKEASE